MFSATYLSAAGRRAVAHSWSDSGDHDDERVVIVLDGRVELAVGRLDAAAEATPEIDFPVQIKADGVVIEEREIAGGQVRAVAADGVARDVGERS